MTDHLSIYETSRPNKRVPHNTTVYQCTCRSHYNTTEYMLSGVCRGCVQAVHRAITPLRSALLRRGLSIGLVLLCVLCIRCSSYPVIWAQIWNGKEMISKNKNKTKQNKNVHEKKSTLIFFTENVQSWNDSWPEPPKWYSGRNLRHSACFLKISSSDGSRAPVRAFKQSSQTIIKWGGEVGKPG